MFVKPAYAQCMRVGTEEICGVLDPKFTNISSILNVIVPFVIGLGGILLFLIILWGGFDLMNSQGAPEKIKTARAKITSGVVGFILLVLSYLITRIVAFVLGIGGGIV